MMLKFDHDQTNSHRVINKRFGVEECWSYINVQNISHQASCIFSQGYFLHFVLIFTHLWRFGVGVLGFGSLSGFWGFRFSVDGICGLWCGALWVCGVGALYINIEE